MLADIRFALRALDPMAAERSCRAERGLRPRKVVERLKLCGLGDQSTAAEGDASEREARCGYAPEKYDLRNVIHVTASLSGKEFTWSCKGASSNGDSHASQDQG